MSSVLNKIMLKILWLCYLWTQCIKYKLLLYKQTGRTHQWGAHGTDQHQETGWYKMWRTSMKTYLTERNSVHASATEVATLQL